MNKPGLHLENSNLDGYDVDRDKHADKRDSSKGKCVCSIDILLATEICGNAHEDLKLSFGDSYDDYDNVPSTLLSRRILVETKLMPMT